MKILSEANKQGIRKYNNDIKNNMENIYYVMDGATPLFDDNIFFETSDSYEYMQLLKKNIVVNENIKESFKNGIIESNKKFLNLENYNEYELPTFTMAAVKEKDTTYELFLLCDCLISILYKNGEIENYEDHRFDKIKFECRKEIKEKIEMLEISEQEKSEMKREVFRKYRKFANAQDGYPVGSTNPESIENMIVKEIEKAKIDKILLCSDGLYDEIGIPKEQKDFDNAYLEEKLKDIKNKDDLTYILISNE
ncbi:MAG: hypothetical protein IKK43_05205 [Clostridia bacterium]|nr:hypothetical protein [Clostridia bacterium]